MERKVKMLLISAKKSLYGNRHQGILPTKHYTMLSHHYDEIRMDEILEDLEINGIDLKMFADSPITEIIDPDLYYPQSSEAWNILKFLRILKTDSFINYHHQRHSWGIE